MIQFAHDVVHFVEAHKIDFALIFAWMVREMSTVAKAGGAKNLWMYFWAGVNPKANNTQPNKQNTNTNEKETPITERFGTQP